MIVLHIKRRWIQGIALILILRLLIACDPYIPTGKDLKIQGVLSAGLLKDIHLGSGQEVHSGWVQVNGVLYFIANNAHEIWSATQAGVASRKKDLGLRDSASTLIADERSISVATRFYFLVNGVQIWTSNGTTTSLVVELQDGNGVLSASAIGNHLYYQLSDYKVYKISDGNSAVQLTTGGNSFSAVVTFVPATTTMYFHGNHATNQKLYSHVGTSGSATEVKDLGGNASVRAGVVTGDDYYFQINDTDANEDDQKVYKSVSGGVAAEVKDDSGNSFVEDVSFAAGSATVYMYGNHATNHVVYAHSGSGAANSSLVGSLGTGASVGASALVGDDFYYQVTDLGGDESDNKVFKSVAGALATEVKDDAGNSFTQDVTLLAGETILYLHGNHLSDRKVYSHTGATTNNSVLVLAAGANAYVRDAAVLADDLYFQIEDSNANENDGRVFKSVDGASAAAAYIYSSGSTHFTADVSFLAGSSTMFIFGNDSTNTQGYAHKGVAGPATKVFTGGTGTLQTAKMKIVDDTWFFHGRTTPTGLFASDSGATAVSVTEFEPNQDDNSLCTTAYTPLAYGARLFFVANNGSAGCELWVTSGTAASTFMVKDINEGAGHAHPSDFTMLGSRLYFSASDNNTGNRGLFYSDSPYTTANKVTLTGADANANPRLLTAVGTKLYFGASVGGNAIVYAHAGTGAASSKSEAAGGTLLKMDPLVKPSIVALGSMAIIRGSPAGDNNYELYYSSSASAIGDAATLMKEINAGASADPILTKVIHDGSTLFFTADDGVNGRELWTTKGTSVTTAMVRNINQSSSAAADADPEQITLLGDSVYFVAVDGASALNDKELWVSSSPFTSATKLTSWTGASLINDLMVFKRRVLFTASDDNGTTIGLFSSDGTSAGTKRFYGGFSPLEPPKFNADFSLMNDSLFFVATTVNGDYGSELWRSTGTNTGTAMLEDLPSGSADGVADADGFSTLGNYLIFVGSDGTYGKELWYTSKSGGAPQMIFNVNPDESDSTAPQFLGKTSNSVYYLINDGDHGKALYRITEN